MLELLDKLQCKKYFRKTNHLPEAAVVSRTSYLPKCSYLAW